jgi:hypothetical protein
MDIKQFLKLNLENLLGLILAVLFCLILIPTLAQALGPHAYVTGTVTKIKGIETYINCDYQMFSFHVDKILQAYDIKDETINVATCLKMSDGQKIYEPVVEGEKTYLMIWKQDEKYPQLPLGYYDAHKISSTDWFIARWIPFLKYSEKLRRDTQMFLAYGWWLIILVIATLLGLIAVVDNRVLKIVMTLILLIFWGLPHIIMGSNLKLFIGVLVMLIGIFLLGKIKKWQKILLILVITLIMYSLSFSFW